VCLVMAADDSGVSDDRAATQNWGADGNGDDLPHLNNTEWADDTDDELPPIDPSWANAPVPTSPEKKAAAFRSKDDRAGGADGRGGSVFSRLGEGGGNAWRRPGDGPPDRGAPPDRHQAVDRQPPPMRRDPPQRENDAGDGDAGRAARERENPHDWHREQMRQQDEQRRQAGAPPVRRNPVRETRGANNNAPPVLGAEVVYLGREEQKAAATKREEDAAWRLAVVPVTAFHTSLTQKDTPYAPSACRELLNVLSEPPFADGKLAPPALAAFTTVASVSKCGLVKSDLEIAAVVAGVIGPLHHLLTHGVATPPGTTTGSQRAFIAEQMLSGSTKLLAAALEVLAHGDVTKTAVADAKGVELVRALLREQMTKDVGKGGKASEKHGAVRVSERPASESHKRGVETTKNTTPAPVTRRAAPVTASDQPHVGADRDRWEKKPVPPSSMGHGTPPSMSVSSDAAGRVANTDEPRGARGSGRASLDQDGQRRGGVGEKRSPVMTGDSAEPVRPRVVPKVVIRPALNTTQSGSREAPTPPVPKVSDRKPVPPSSNRSRGGGGSAFSRLEGSPSPSPNVVVATGPKPPPGKPPGATNRTVPAVSPIPAVIATPLKPHSSRASAVPYPKGTAAHEPPHPKQASAPRPPPGRELGGKPSGKSVTQPDPTTRGTKNFRDKKNHGKDEWHALDEELEKVSISRSSKGARGGKPRDDANSSGDASKKKDPPPAELPHPKPVSDADKKSDKPGDKPSPVPAPKPAPSVVPVKAALSVSKQAESAAKDDLDTVLDDELAKAKKSRRGGGRGGRGGKV